MSWLPPKTTQDGVYPEKVNAGRKQANGVMRSIGKAKDPAAIKFTGVAGIFDA